MRALRDEGVDVPGSDRSPAVIGTALWGEVIEHEFGYRARFRYPQRLRIVCPECLWRHVSLDRSPVVVAVLEDGAPSPSATST